MERDPARDLVYDLAREGVARAGRGEDLPRVERRREHGRPASLRGELRGERRDRARARVDVLRQPDEREVDLAGRAVVSAMELAAQDEAGTHAGADREEEEVVDPARDALPVLAERREVDVVLERHGQPEPSPEVRRERVTLETSDARRERDPAALGVDDARDADDCPVQERAVEARRGDQPLPEAADLVEDAPGVAPFDLDVEARAGVPAKVTDRAAQEAAAHVETEHERGLRHRLEEHGTVARPCGLARRLADEARLEERLERERDGRLGDSRAAGDLGARDGRPGADRLEHGPLVHVLEKRREGRSGDVGLRIHGCSRMES